ncbi:MAG: acyl carrier protein [Pseudomonadota bacterium]|nr:acyl carrier protein [Pseudomonadota bacterium]
MTTSNLPLQQTVLRILKSIAPDADTAALDPDMSFHDQFEIDSLDYLRLITELEKTLKIRVADADYPRLSTLRGCESYLAAKLNS